MWIEHFLMLLSDYQVHKIFQTLYSTFNPVIRGARNRKSHPTLDIGCANEDL
jgi:hypothetical protein